MARLPLCLHCGCSILEMHIYIDKVEHGIKEYLIKSDGMCLEKRGDVMTPKKSHPSS